MPRHTIVLLVVVVAVGVGVAGLPPPPAPPGPTESEPDTRKARQLDHWPNARDLDRLKSVEGKSRAQVIRVLGHPKQVERRPDGTEVWDYPWLAACRVWIKGGVCTGTFYTSGY
jgi:hypothetical protein